MNLLCILAKRLTSPRFDARLAQIACYAGGLVTFVAAVLKLCSLPVSEFQLLVGLLLAVACLLLCITLGTLVPLAARLSRQ
jgi:hypothetical protein